MSVNDIDAYRDKVNKRVEVEKGKGAGKKEGAEKKVPDLDFIRKCFMANEVGDSLLYNFVHHGQFAYNVITQRWMTWANPHWVIDHNCASLAAAEGVVNEYLRLVADYDEKIKKAQDKNESKKLIDKKTGVLKRIYRLRKDSGRKSVLSCCRSNSDPLTIHSDQMDKEPWLLPCANGVIDLRTGVLRPGRPEDYLTHHSPIEWKGIDEPAPKWEKYLSSALDGNQEVIGYLNRVLGYSITGLNLERLFVVFFGKHGQSGKGTMMEILYHVLGSLSGPIQSEMLMSQKFSKSSSGPSPDLMALKGRRLGWASEIEDGQSFAAGRIKLFSGGDPLVGRGLNDREQTTFMPTHLLFLLCNHLPHAPADDNGFWERIKVINFPFSFVRRKPTAKHEREADPDLMLDLKKESPGILAWLVRGCLEWQKKGQAVPTKVLDDSLKYRRTEDDLQDFIEQCCKVDQEDPKLREPAAAMYARYKVWWISQSPSRPMSSKKFGDIMSRKGFDRIKSSGKISYIGICLVITAEGN